MKDYVKEAINNELERLNNELYFKDLKIENLERDIKNYLEEIERLKEDLALTEQAMLDWKEAAENRGVINEF